MNSPGLIAKTLLGLCVGLGWFSSAQEQADTRPKLTLTREDKTIQVIQNGRSAGGAQFIPTNPQCREGFSVGTVYAPKPGFVETLVNNTRITSAIALLNRPEGTEEEEKLELFGGTLGINDDLCPINVKRNQEADITISEGRTTTEGKSLVYDNATGIGEVDGPIQLNRREEGNSPALAASASRLSFNVDNDLTTLRGNVEVESEGRTSEADVLELDEEAGFAILRGNPARSRNEDGVVAGQVIEYDLDSNDVVVRGGIEATFDLDTGGEETSLPSFGGSAEASDTGDEAGDTETGDTEGDDSGTNDTIPEDLDEPGSGTGDNDL